MLFKPTSLYQFYKRYETLDLTPIHQSNPQPFTMIELEAIIGKKTSFLDDQLELGYASLQGDLRLREAITTLYEHENPDEIATFVGAQEAIFCAMYSLLKAKDKVVAISPIFAPLIATAEEIGCEIDLVSLTPTKDKWVLDLAQLEASIKADCKLLIINFPHNPTGAMLTEDELLKIIDICDQNNCWILSDEVFRGLEFKPEQRLPAVADLYPQAISIGVLSKSFATPAIRIGWISCQDKMIIERMIEIKSSFSICTSHIDEQFAIHIILQHEKVWERSRNKVLNNFSNFDRNVTKSHLLSRFIKPQAGCVCFPLLNDAILASDFSEELIQNKNLMTLPADLFISSHNGIRLGFGYDNNSHLISSIFST